MKKIMDEDRVLAFAQEQPIPVVEMLINLMNGVVRRRKAAEKGSPAATGASPVASSTRARKPRTGPVAAPAPAELQQAPANAQPPVDATVKSNQAAEPQALDFNKV